MALDEGVPRQASPDFPSLAATRAPEQEDKKRQALGPYVWRMASGKDGLFTDNVGPSLYAAAQGRPVRIWGMMANDKLCYYVSGRCSCGSLCARRPLELRRHWVVGREERGLVELCLGLRGSRPRQVVVRRGIRGARGDVHLESCIWTLGAGRGGRRDTAKPNPFKGHCSAQCSAALVWGFPMFDALKKFP